MKLIKAILRLFSLILLIALMAMGYIGYQGYQMYQNAVQNKSVEQMAEEIRSKADYTALDQLPDTYKKAVIAVEDHRFYEHLGIDPIAVARALWNDLRTFSMAEGGSTITQQIAKNEYFTQEKDITRKAAEIFMALEMEKKLSKNEILELYVNSIFFGNGYECVYEASVGYFGKTPMELSEGESTLLAGIPNAPSVYNPIANPELAAKRQRQVEKKLLKYSVQLK